MQCFYRCDRNTSHCLLCCPWLGSVWAYGDEHTWRRRSSSSRRGGRGVRSHSGCRRPRSVTTEWRWQRMRYQCPVLFYSEVTRHLAYVIKAMSSLLPFLSASKYAATPGRSVIHVKYKTKATTAQVWISYFHCLMSSRSG
jgi:hypothetical protein